MGQAAAGPPRVPGVACLGPQTRAEETLRAHLAALAEHHAAYADAVAAVNDLQIRLETDVEPVATLRPRLESAYDAVKARCGEEEACVRSGWHDDRADATGRVLTAAIDGLNALIAIKNTPEPPLTLTEKRGGKKRRLDLSTGSPMPESPIGTPTGGVLPGTAAPATGPLSAIPPGLGASLRNASPGPPTPGGTVRAKTPRAAAREAQLYDGRPIAFKTPPAKGRPAKDTDKKRQRDDAAVESGTWILAKILRCVDREKGRYEVQDADDEGGTAATYVTTHKSMIPLPDVRNKDPAVAGPPPPVYRAGTDVLALYPDSTALYRGRVKEPPAARGAAYSIIFEGDEAPFHHVAPEYVTEWPGGM